MANIALNKPSGGQLILSPEDGTSTETVTIPSVGVGKILQVKQYATSSGSVTNSTSYVDTNLNVSITPTSVTSKIYVSMVAGTGSSSNAHGQWVRLVRDSTELVVRGAYVGSTQHQSIPMTIEYLDSPNTTSEITYKITIRNDGTSTTMSFISPYNTSYGAGTAIFTGTITVMEVAA